MHDLILEQITPADLAAEVQAVLGAASNDGTLLRFKNAVLARVETNKNRDALSAEFLQGVADTLPLMPIDIDHSNRDLCGVFTAGRLDDGALYTDGIIYMARYPEVAAGIQAKPPTHFLSIEASGLQAQCSLCGNIFENGKNYCAHLTAKQVSGAVRKMLGRGKALGGAVTKNPAGSGTHFDPSQVGVLASVEGAKEAPLTFLSETEFQWFRQGMLSKVLASDTRTALPDADFALLQDGVRRFPLTNLMQARHALAQLDRVPNLTDAEKTTVRSRAEAKIAESKQAVQDALTAAAKAAADTIYRDVLSVNPGVSLLLHSPILAPHYYNPPPPETTPISKESYAAVQAELDKAKVELAAAQQQLVSDQAVAQVAASEKDETVKQLQGKIDELEAVLREKDKPNVGLTAIALGTKPGNGQRTSPTPIRVVAK